MRKISFPGAAGVTRRPRAHVLGMALSLCGLGTAVQAQSADYHFTVDTSSLQGQSAYLDFQFNAGGSDPTMTALPATMAITDWQTDGALSFQPLPPAGDVTGSLPGGSLVIGNDSSNARNEFTQYLTFGTSLSFNALLSGPALTPRRAAISDRQ